MNCNPSVPPQQSRFQEPISQTPSYSVAGTTSRKIAKQDLSDETRRMLVHYFPPSLSLSAFNGGQCAADVFALLTMAQLIEQWDLAFYMPVWCRRMERQCVVVSLGTKVLQWNRFDFKCRHARAVPNDEDRDCLLNISFLCHQAFRRGIQLWRRAIEERVSAFQITTANGGTISMCFNFQEALRFIDYRNHFSHAGHSCVDREQLPLSKLQSSIRDKLMWYTETDEVNKRFKRLFFLVQMNHKVVLVIYHDKEKNLVVFDPQMPSKSDVPTVQELPQTPAVHHIARAELQAGLRIGVACISELCMFCDFICEELYSDFGGQTPTTKICFDVFVVGDGEEVLSGEE